MNIIGDIAAQYEAVISLIDQMPKQKTIFLGDLNDRGWRSKEVIQFAIDNSDIIITLDSNHGDIFIDWFMQKTEPKYAPRYHADIFEMNGGRPTMASYGHDIGKCFKDELLSDKDLCSHVEWLNHRPTHLLEVINGQSYIFSHAPLNPNPNRSFKQFLLKGAGFVSYPFTNSENNYQWNRNEPSGFHKDLPNVISIFGHNSGKDLKLFCKQYDNGIYVKDSDKLQQLLDINSTEVYGICIDTSRSERICGLDLNNMNIYYAPYMKEKEKEIK